MLPWLYKVPYGLGLVLRKGRWTGKGLDAAELRPGPVILEQAVRVFAPMEAEVSVEVDAVTALEERRDGPRPRTTVFAPEPVRAVRVLVSARGAAIEVVRHRNVNPCLLAVPFRFAICRERYADKKRGSLRI